MACAVLSFMDGAPQPDAIGLAPKPAISVPRRPAHTRFPQVTGSRFDRLIWIIADARAMRDTLAREQRRAPMFFDTILNPEPILMLNGRDEIVAVVDDDPAVLDLLKFLLEVVGYKVAAYASAASFLDDDTIEPACLIVDQHMPRLTGLDLAARLRAGGVDIPLLLITGLPSPAIDARAAELGVEAVLEKPPSTDAILRFVGAHV